MVQAACGQYRPIGPSSSIQTAARIVEDTALVVASDTAPDTLPNGDGEP
jgi:hypothetical protein